MIPTMHLRFVERNEIVQILDDGTSIGRSVKVLQQWWVDVNDSRAYTVNSYVHAVFQRPGTFKGEWRDVEEEKP